MEPEQPATQSSQPRSSWDYDKVLPTEVPEYEYARQQGWTPQVAATPPSLLPGKSAAELGNRLMVGLVVSFFAIIVIILLLKPKGVFAMVVGALCIAYFVGLYWKFTSVGNRVVQELQAGYATFQLVMGSYWMGSLKPGAFVPAWRNLAWDYSGTWLLDPRTGQAKNTPMASAIAPGFYPSPHIPGKLELWTGIAWTGNLRRPPGELSINQPAQQ